MRPIHGLGSRYDRIVAASRRIVCRFPAPKYSVVGSIEKPPTFAHDGYVFVVTEGGYELSALAESLNAVIRVLAGDDGWVGESEMRRSTGRGERAADAVRKARRSAGL